MIALFYFHQRPGLSTAATAIPAAQKKTGDTKKKKKRNTPSARLTNNDDDDKLSYHWQRGIDNSSPRHTHQDNKKGGEEIRKGTRTIDAVPSRTVCPPAAAACAAKNLAGGPMVTGRGASCGVWDHHPSSKKKNDRYVSWPVVHWQDHLLTRAMASLYSSYGNHDNNKKSGPSAPKEVVVPALYIAPPDDPSHRKSIASSHPNNTCLPTRASR